jgi:hypothetical protein
VFDCGYPVVINVSGEKSFITHNEDTQDFTIYTEDLSADRTYAIRITGTISIPNAAPKTAVIEASVKIGDNCETSHFMDFSIDNMVTYVTEGVFEQSLP